MSIAFDLLGINVFVNMPCAVVLSISTGVFGCGSPYSINASLRPIPILAFTHAAAVSASDAAPITLLKILASTCVGTLIRCHCVAIGLDLSHTLPKKWCPPTLLLAFEIDKNDESDEIHSITSDFLHVMDALGWFETQFSNHVQRFSVAVVLLACCRAKSLVATSNVMSIIQA